VDRVISLSDDEIRDLRTIMHGTSKFGNSEKILAKFDRAQHRITSASAKSKGRSLQVWVCQKIAAFLGVEWSNSDDESLVASRPMGQHGCDVVLRGEARRRFLWDLECKATKEIRIVDAVKQAEANTGEGRFAGVVYRQTGSVPVVIMSWDTFEAINRVIYNPVS
jgi:hypothetical protein